MDYYGEALKEGLKQYKDSIHRSEYPYLPALDDMLPVDRLAVGRSMGITQIPMEFIAGTKSSGRTKTFAKNFMPVMPETSEFASKWKMLCKSQLEEGIREPVTAYEYMNRYYIAEGNKRVSVLRFFGAVSIPGEVTRILPERDGTEEVEIYYELIEFMGISGINFLEFHKRGSYKKFLMLLGRESKENWDDETVRNVRREYYYFRQAFMQAGKEKSGIFPGDAFLSCINIYGYDSLQDKNESNLKDMILRAWKEIALVGEDDAIDVIEDPAESGPGLLTRIIPKPKPLIKAAFLYNKSPDDSGWASAHEQGRQMVQDRMQDVLTSEYYVCKDDEETQNALEQAINEGASVIFATSAEMLGVCLKTAIDYPKVNILSCSINVPHKYIRMYYPRMYETGFISGAVAGAVSKNNMAGYICNYPVYGNIAEINAFARGARLTDPESRIYLEWSGDSSISEAVKKLTDRGIRLIFVRDAGQSRDKGPVTSGLQYICEDGTYVPLTNPVWNWGVYYERMINNILYGRFQEQEQKTSHSLNYYWGMSAGVAEIEFSEDLPGGVRYLGELLRKNIRMGICKPFFRPETGEDGKYKWHDVGSTVSIEEIVKMDRLESNVEGYIPSYEQLSDRARRLVDVLGVPSARKDPDILL